MTDNKFYITHLYPKDMSIYGDIGNILAIEYQLKMLGIEYVYQAVNIGDELPESTDLYFIGGGQDKEQYLIYPDLLKKQPRLKDDIENGVCLLAICGGYQAFGKEFITGDGVTIPGLGILPVTTRAADLNVQSRCIGNIIVQSTYPDFENSILVGFENHSGQTYFIDDVAKPLGKVLLGFGNNSVEKLEGCVYKNAIGTYLHGSCLPKNPELSNWLIKQAMERKNQSVDFGNLDNSIGLEAKSNLIQRLLV